MAPQPVEHRLLYRVACAYYDQGLTQQEIARRFGLSRPKVSRLLAQARDERVVVITLVSPPEDRTSLEQRLEAHFGLAEAVVVPSPAAQDAEAVAGALALAAADCLMRTLAGASILGIAWGSSIRAVVEALPAARLSDLTVVQLNGGLGPVGEVEHSTELAQRLAQRIGARLRLLPAPGIVSSLAVARALFGERQVQETLAVAAAADVAVVGLGVPRPDSVLVRDGSLVTKEDIAELRSLGAVGDIALRYVDEQGKAIEGGLAERTIGLTMDDLRRIPRVIGVAGGLAKRAIIRAALAGGLLDVLVTDEDVARALLEEEQNG